MMLSVATSSTAMVETSHAVEQLIRRPGFAPKVYYSDIYPNGKEFWEMMLGPGIPGRLGMFHYFQRIVRTLRDGHEFSVPAIRDLKQCIYEYDQQDLNDLVAALKEGRMGNRGKKHTTSEINAMMYTREWKQPMQQPPATQQVQPQPPYYMQQYMVPMQQPSMQQMPPMMMPPGWKHPRLPPQIDGFCCRKKERAVREKRVGKHPHSKNCPIKLWKKENSKSKSYYV